MHIGQVMVEASDARHALVELGEAHVGLQVGDGSAWFFWERWLSPGATPPAAICPISTVLCLRIQDF